MELKSIARHQVLVDPATSAGGGVSSGFAAVFSGLMGQSVKGLKAGAGVVAGVQAVHPKGDSALVVERKFEQKTTLPQPVVAREQGVVGGLSVEQPAQGSLHPTVEHGEIASVDPVSTIQTQSIDAASVLPSSSGAAGKGGASVAGMPVRSPSRKLDAPALLQPELTKLVSDVVSAQSPPQSVKSSVAGESGHVIAQNAPISEIQVDKASRKRSFMERSPESIEAPSASLAAPVTLGLVPTAAALLIAETSSSRNSLATTVASPESPTQSRKTVDIKAHIDDARALRSAPDEKIFREAGVAKELFSALTFDKHFAAADGGTRVVPPTVPHGTYEVTQTVGQEGWSNAISKTVVSMVADGLMQAKVSVTPENLGPLDIKITMEKGAVGVDFYSPYQDVREALAAGSDQLQARFAEAGVTLERVSSHDTLPVLKEELAQEQSGKQERDGRQQEQRRESKQSNSWFSEMLARESDT